MILASLSGMVAGTVHVVSGPDHIAAIAPLAAEGKQGAWKIGFRWGLGHASGVLLVGFLSILLREVLPVNLISGWAERLVGVVLIGIGLWGLNKALTARIHTHRHDHNGEAHSHIHFHKPEAEHIQDDTKNSSNHHGNKVAHNHTHTAFAIGTLHGLAGSSHFLGVLPALAFPTRFEAGSYLIFFGIGTIFAMSIFSTIIGEVSRRYAGGTLKTYKIVMGTLSIIAIGVGIVWLFQ
jgi:ABC-type nickel/cobalt efflux system permease component RcnA